MATTWKDIIGTVLTGALQTLYTFSPSLANGAGKVYGIPLVNNSANDRIVEIYQIPVGLTATQQYLVWRATVPANDSLTAAWSTAMPASGGTFIQAKQVTGTGEITAKPIVTEGDA